MGLNTLFNKVAIDLIDQSEINHQNQFKNKNFFENV